MPDAVYILCVKYFFGRVKPISYFRNKKSAEAELSKCQHKHKCKRYYVETVLHSLADSPEVYVAHIK